MKDNATKQKQSVGAETKAMQKEKQTQKHAHYGHRARMRERFKKGGLNSFQPHEVLELALFYVLPCCDTNGIAHELIERFHSISGVLDADAEDLKRVKGISDNAAVYLKMLPQLCEIYQLDKMRDREAFHSTKEICEYLRIRFCSATQEQILLLCLDESLQLLHSETISEGTTRSSILDVHRITECALRWHSSRVVLSHNHPHAEADATDADIFATKRLKRTLCDVQVDLMDHIIIGKYGDAFSMKEHGLMG